MSVPSRRSSRQSTLRRAVGAGLVLLLWLPTGGTAFAEETAPPEPVTVAEDPTPTEEAAPSEEQAPSPTEAPAPEAPRSSYLVTFADGVGAGEQSAALDGAEATQVDSITAVGVAVAALTDAGVDQLRSDARVVRVEAEAVREIQGTPNDPAYADQWSLPQIGWDQAFGVVEPSSSATVAVLDTGVDATDDLAGRLVGGVSTVDGVDATTDGNGHGTAMASLVAARADNGAGIAGVGYAGVSVMPVKVLGADGTGQDFDIVEGVVHAADHGADVILMAFSNPGRSAALQAAADYAWAQGAVLVAATGNDGSTTATYPAGLAKVVGVSATTRDDTLWSGSNSGDATFLGAPGVDIATGSGSVSGTSASAALVAGSAALLAAADSSASNGVIVGRLARNADPAGSASDTGNGRLNVARALADSGTDAVAPAGVAGDGGPIVGPYVAAGNASVTGIVRNFVTGDPIFNATVTCTVAGGCNSLSSTTTDATGRYTLGVNFPGNSATIQITASASGYAPSSASVTPSNTFNPDAHFALVPTNTAPVAVNDSYSTSEESPLTVAAASGVLANDTDADGNPMTAALVDDVDNGSLTLNSNGSFSYAPSAHYDGPDSFTYRASDGTATSNLATVSITVASVNDAPAGADNTVTVLEDGSHTFAAGEFGFSDPNDSPADVLSAVVITTVPGVGALALDGSPVSAGAVVPVADILDGKLQFAPAVNANGAGYASFTFQVRDNGGTANGGVNTDQSANTMTVDVTSVNDAPLAVADGYSTNEDAGLTVTISGVLSNDTDADGNALTANLVTGPEHGSLTLNANGSFSYTPAANYNGPDSFTYKANDGSLDSNVATVSITVNAVNDAPVADGETYSTDEDTVLAEAVGNGVLVGDTDVDEDSLAAVLVDDVEHGSLTLNSNGSFSLCSERSSTTGRIRSPTGPVTVTATSNLATVSITVASVNDAPAACGQHGRRCSRTDRTRSLPVSSGSVTPTTRLLMSCRRW